MMTNKKDFTSDDDYIYNPFSLYTPQFLKSLKETLGDPKEFQNLSLKKQKEIQNEIECLVSDENSWHYNVKKGKCTSFDDLRYSEQFYLEYSNFEDFWLKNVVLASNKGTTGQKRNVYSTQINLLSSEFILLTQSNTFTDQFKNKLLNIEIMDKKIIEDNFSLTLTPHRFFNISVLAIYEEVYAKLFTKKNLNLEVDEFLKSYAIELMTENLIKLFSVKYYEILFSNLNPDYFPQDIDSKNGCETKLSEFIEGACIFLAFSKKSEKIKIIARNISVLLFRALEESSFLEKCTKKIHNKKGGFMFVYRVQKLVGSGTPVLKRHVPHITPPEDLTKENIYIKSGVYKTINSGHSDFIFSESALNALNISQKKCYRVNESFLAHLEELDSSIDPDISDKLPFPNKFKLEKAIQSYNNYKKDIKNPILSILYKNHNIKKSKTKNEHQSIETDSTELECTAEELHIDSLWELENFLNPYELESEESWSEIGSTKLEEKMIYKLKNLEKELNAIELKRQVHLTNLEIARIYAGFPIYFSISLDYRGRLYPWSWLMSKTCGYLKYLLSDFKYIELTNYGLFYMLSAFFIPNKTIFEEYLREYNIHSSRESLALFFNANLNSIDLLTVDNFIYFSILKIEIEYSLKSNYLSNFMVEMDMKGSGQTLLGLLTGNKALCDACSLLGKEPKDINTILQLSQTSFINGLKDKLTPQSKIQAKDFIPLENLLTKYRKPNKLMLMCYSYGQGIKGRTRDLINQDKSIFGSKLTKTEILAFDLYSKQFPLLLSQKFDNIIQINKVLLKAQSILLRNTQKVSVETLDGCKIYWSVFKKVRKATRIYMTSSKQPLRPVNYETLSTEIDLSKQFLSFIVAFIHSLDAGVVRLFINKMESRKSYSIQHLHDSFSMHPNFVPEFKECLHYIFTSGEYVNPETLNKLFFNPAMNTLPDDISRLELKTLKEQCSSLRTMTSDDYLKLKDFVIQDNICPFEH